MAENRRGGDFLTHVVQPKLNFHASFSMWMGYTLFPYLPHSGDERRQPLTIFCDSQFGYPRKEKISQLFCALQAELMCIAVGYFSCYISNPCTYDNIRTYGHYFPHYLRTKYIQCGVWDYFGQFSRCQEHTCPYGRVWDQTITSCNYPGNIGNRKYRLRRLFSWNLSELSFTKNDDPHAGSGSNMRFYINIASSSCSCGKCYSCTLVLHSLSRDLLQSLVSYLNTLNNPYYRWAS